MAGGEASGTRRGEPSRQGTHARTSSDRTSLYDEITIKIIIRGTRGSASSRRSAGVGDLCVLDVIKHELLAGEKRSKARRIGVFMTGTGEEHVEVIVVRGPAPPVIVSARILVAHAQQVFDRRRAA